jgi:hypothetical protein
MLQSNLVAGFLSRILESTVLPAWVNLVFKRDNSTDQPVGDHVDSSQAALFQEMNLVDQGRSTTPEIQGVGLQKEGGWVRGSHCRTTSRAIPEGKSSS